MRVVGFASGKWQKRYATNCAELTSRTVQQLVGWGFGERDGGSTTTSEEKTLRKF